MKHATTPELQTRVINTQLSDIDAAITRAFGTRSRRRHPNSGRWITRKVAHGRADVHTLLISTRRRSA